MLRRGITVLLALTSLSLISASAQFIGAGHTLVVEHGVYQVGPNSATPIYNPQGFLLTPGGGYPTVMNPTIVSTAFENWASGSPGGAFLSWTTLPQYPFGGAGTDMVSVVGPFTGRIWWTNYWVRDVPANDGVGSYNASGGNVLFQNGPIAWGGRAGIFFPFAGFALGNAYVAGAMMFELIIFDANNITVADFFLGVHFGFDGLGPRPDGVSVWGTTPAFWGWRFNHFGTTFSGYGLAWTPVVIPPGGKVLLKGRLTLLADPDGGFDITNEFDNLPEVIANLPNLGYTPVPEPASMAALGVGLLTLLARWRRRVA